MSLFDSFTASVKSFGDKIGGYFTPAPAPAPAPKVTNQRIQPTQPKTAIPAPPPQTSVFDKVGGFLDGLQSIAGKVVESASVYRDLKTAQELEKIRNRAILEAAQGAPNYSQTMLPTTGDFVRDPEAARLRVFPSIATSGENIFLIAGLGVLAFFALKR